MCNPLAMAALGALQIHGQNQQAKAQLAAQEAQAKAAFRTANAQQSALQSQKNLQMATAVEELTQDQLRAAQATADARVSAGEAGISGVGVNRIMSDIGQQVSSNAAVTQRNLLTQQANVSAQQETLQSNLQSTIKELQTPVQGPTILDAALAIGGGYLQGASMANAMGINSGFALDTVTGEVVKGTNVSLLDTIGNKLGMEGYNLAPITAVNASAINSIIGEGAFQNQVLQGAKGTTAAKKGKYGFELGYTGQAQDKLNITKIY